MWRLPKIGFSLKRGSIFSSMRERFATKIESVDREEASEQVKAITIDEGGAVKFRDRYSSFARKVTITITLAVVVAAFLLWWSSTGTYLYAWFVSLALSVFALFVMSIPKYVRVSQESVEIHCVLEMTSIRLKDIRRVHRIESYRVRQLIPLIGSYGFWGFYGYYFDAIHLRIVRLYAKKLSGMVVLQDIYNTRYYVSCSDSMLMVNTIRQQIALLREEDIVLDKASGDDDDNDFDE